MCELLPLLHKARVPVKLCDGAAGDCPDGSILHAAIFVDNLVFGQCVVYT